MTGNSETQVKLFFTLPLNKGCGFPSVRLMENSDLLMMITSGKVPPLQVLSQPSSLRSAMLNLWMKILKECGSFLSGTFSKEEKIFPFQPGHDGDSRGRHTPPVRARAHSHAVVVGFVLAKGHVGAGAAWGTMREGRPKAPIRVTSLRPSKLQPVQWKQRIWTGIMLFACASTGLTLFAIVEICLCQQC